MEFTLKLLFYYPKIEKRINLTSAVDNCQSEVKYVTTDSVYVFISNCSHPASGLLRFLIQPKHNSVFARCI